MTCIKCGTSIPSYATACSGCTRDVYSEGAGVGITDPRNLFFLFVLGLVIAIIKLIAWSFDVK